MNSFTTFLHKQVDVGRKSRQWNKCKHVDDFIWLGHIFHVDPIYPLRPWTEVDTTYVFDGKWRGPHMLFTYTRTNSTVATCWVKILLTTKNILHRSLIFPSSQIQSLFGQKTVFQSFQILYIQPTQHTIPLCQQVPSHELGSISWLFQRCSPQRATGTPGLEGCGRLETLYSL